MRRPQLPAPNDDQGLIWGYAFDNDTHVLGHSGAYYGVSTDMWFDPATGAGYVLLTNGGVYFDDKNPSPQVAAMNDLNFKLMELALALP